MTSPIGATLPRDERRAQRAKAVARSSFAMLLRNRQLVATYAIGFGILCTLIAAFTYVTFHLAAPPYQLSTAALGWLFITYLVAIATQSAPGSVDQGGGAPVVAFTASFGPGFYWFAAYCLFSLASQQLTSRVLAGRDEASLHPGASHLR